MKKYVLIKEYPGSPKLGTIINDEITTYGISFSKNNLSFIKKYPEFWQPVVEKDYEILEYISKLKNCIIEPKNPLFNNGDWDIHSVRRLSDSEIFTIGDKIFPNNKIYKFELKNNILKIWHCDISFSTPIIEGPSGQPGNCSWIKGINNIKKIKQPLFTTEDINTEDLEKLVKQKLNNKN